ncbi:hypothetical protein AMK59_897 [Oryctes borbonicus]|uniref:Mid1-interacting protein 1 n=1 Tax=Oryctes borbonicus TaxID=1629725 RepID=A0A0T6BBQ8_9SCAR|nr:hypothetical protein AMK59_897 [Oryctes borbonicus]
MISYTDNITASMDSRNCLRRIGRHDDTEFSHQSVINVMERFVRSVNTMDDTILVPCRLMDMKVGDEQDPTDHKQNSKSKHDINNTLNSADLLDLYNMLHSIKADLLWCKGEHLEKDEESQKNTNSSNTHLTVKGHVRRPSTVSVTSTNSVSSISDTESETGNEIDSGIEEPPCVTDRTQQVAQNFRRHLYGLTKSLKQFTEAAQYLTNRYQYDIGNPI